MSNLFCQSHDFGLRLVVTLALAFVIMGGFETSRVLAANPQFVAASLVGERPKLVELRYDGGFYVEARVFEMDPKGSYSTPVTVPVEQTYTVMVPVTREVDGKEITEMITETRVRTIEVVRMEVGNLERQKFLVEQEAKYYDMDGKSIGGMDLANRIAMSKGNSLNVLVLNEDQEMPENRWGFDESLDAVIVRSDALVGELKNLQILPPEKKDSDD